MGEKHSAHPSWALGLSNNVVLTNYGVAFMPPTVLGTIPRLSTLAILTN